MSIPLPRRPVIVGIGEVVDRVVDLTKAREPLDLMCNALLAADEDSRGLLRKVDSLDVVKHVSTPYSNLPALVCDRLRLECSRAGVTDGSGNGPIREMHTAALRIATGDCEVAAIVGGEAQYSVDQSAKKGIPLNWMPKEAKSGWFEKRFAVNPMAMQYGLVTPVQVYPLYETAATAAWGQSPAQAQAETTAIWAQMSAVAAHNPYAWAQRAYSAQEIGSASSFNRPIAWPYLKLMVAQPSVNLAAAILISSYETARRAGIPDERLIFIGTGTAARESDDYLLRDRYDRNASQTAVLTALLDRLGWGTSEFDCIDLYSCFPIVSKMAQRLLKLPVGQALTVAGGLTFFGGPIHNYMSHATAAMVRHLRARPGSKGLLYGQGGYVTKHHAIAIASGEPAAGEPSADYDVQSLADKIRDPVPDLIDHYSGPASIETYTIVYNRDGSVAYGTILARTPAGQRTVAKVSPEATAILAQLTAPDRSAVGSLGRVERHADSNHWSQ
jgi:acetyl-CoA acetyltransferase